MEQATPSRVFIYDKIRIFFKHTDYHGFVHPYNFFEWTSHAREAFLSEVCKNFREILESSIKMMTAKINLCVFEDSVFGDHIEIRLTSTKIKKVSFDIIARFFNKSFGKIVCETKHTLVFVDSATGGFAGIPKGLADAILEYQEIEEFKHHSFKDDTQERL